MTTMQTNLVAACAMFGLLVGVAAAAGERDGYEVVADKASDDAAAATVRVEPADARTSRALPVRAVVKAADGKFVDGSGRGVYADGRFFSDGPFTVKARPGKLQVELRSGPNYEPLTFTLDAKAGRSVRVRASLRRWFSPESRGWYSGDNHVHAQHDARAAVRTDLAYTALQGRANGLSFITEAGSNVSYDRIDQLDTDTFLLRYAPELRPGPYVGHLNTPGIREPIPKDLYRSLIKRPLPAQAVYEEVRRRGGVVIHTHPMTPRHQLHWMGAAEAWSDAVVGKCADLFDVDANHTQQLWFAMLNLDNRVAVSSYTDAALGRTRTLSPGDRRVYCRADRFDYAGMVDAMRRGRTMATNGGPVFVFLDVGGQGPGGTVTLKTGESLSAKVEVHSLNPLRAVELYQRGRRVAAFNVKGKSGKLELSHTLRLKWPHTSWLVARAEDEDGKWCLTSPVYLEPAEGKSSWFPPSDGAVLFEISNATRFAHLKRDFFAHVIATVSPGHRILEVTILKDGRVFKQFTPAMANQYHDGKVPVTEAHGLYGPGWAWLDRAAPNHFQADWPITETGWYRVFMTTAQRLTIRSDAVRFDADHPNSHSLSVAHLRGRDTDLTLWGYGEEMPLKSIRNPFVGDGWWYPKNGYWRLVARFGDQTRDLGWPREQPVERFRANPKR